jgi:hypothetical protein
LLFEKKKLATRSLTINAKALHCSPDFSMPKAKNDGYILVDFHHIQLEIKENQPINDKAGNYEEVSVKKENHRPVHRKKYSFYFL